MSTPTSVAPARGERTGRGRIRQANARLPAEESIALRVAVTVAVLAAGTATIRQGVGGVLLAVACVVGIPAANVFSHVTRHREGYLLKAFLALGILVAFAAFLASLRGIGAGVVSDVQVPLAELFLWTQLLHSMDVPARRDLQFSLVSSLVLTAIAGVLSLSMGFALHLVVWAVAALTALVLFHRSELHELPVVTPPRGERRPAASLRAVPVIIALVFALGVGAFLLVPPSSTAKVSFPMRLPSSSPVASPGSLSNPSLGDDDPARADGSLENTGARKSFGYFGFAERLDTATRGRPDDTMMLKVRSPRPDFWRGQSFDRWDGREWTLTPERPAEIRGDGVPIDIPPVPGDVPHGSNELVQTFYVQEGGPNIYFAAPVIDQIYTRDNSVFQLSDGTIRSGVEAQEGLVYTVISRRPPVTREILRAASAEEPGPLTPTAFARRRGLPVLDLSRYLQLPEMPARIGELARTITAGAPTTYDKVIAIEQWMAANTEYSLDIPPLPRGADAVDQFLFVDRTGFCEQIGTSLVVMLRSLGIPARLAVGYAPGLRNPFTGLYEVRASDAHSWAEVWFPGVGWQGFDPTANVPLAGDAGPRTAGAGLLGNLTAQVPSTPSWRVGALAGLGGVIAAGALLFQAAQWRASRRRLRARRWAAVLLDRLEEEGRARGRPRQPSQTIYEYVESLRTSVLPDARLVSVAATLQTETFSVSNATDQERAAASAVVEEAVAAWPAGEARRRRR